MNVQRKTVEGQPLTVEDLKSFEKCGISRELAEAAEIRRITSAEAAWLLKRTDNGAYGGIGFPYRWPGSDECRQVRVRRDNPEQVVGKDGRMKPAQKYLGPIGVGNMIYLPPGVSAADLIDTKKPILITEGEKKTLALYRLTREVAPDSVVYNAIPVGLGGVWNWLGRKVDEADAKAPSVPIPDLDRIELKNRKVYIVFDANASTNTGVSAARRKLTVELEKRNAQVLWVELPSLPGVNGVDDLIGIAGIKGVAPLFDQATRPHMRSDAAYETRQDGMFYHKPTGNGTVRVQLTNFAAEIISEVVRDDGVNQNREFEIEAKIRDKPVRLRLPAVDFAVMNWPAEHLGASAVVYPSMKEHARTAIQLGSQNASQRIIYTHTGWRKHNGKWIYLHAAGAIGEEGPVPDVEVDLPGPLGRYVLPSSGADLKQAIRASIDLQNTAPDRVSIPICSGIYRSVLGPCDFSLFLSGESGTGKTALAAVGQQHFGPEMNAQNLPASWASTANALEAYAFHTKDALMVVDDYAPQPDIAGSRRQHATAERLLRSQGNNSGRSRMRSDGTLQAPMPPRGLILATGEDVPPGQSLKARAINLELGPGEINWHLLTDCQRYAADGLYSQALAGFIQWLAPKIEGIQRDFRNEVMNMRDRLCLHKAHARTPMALAELAVGYRYFLRYATELEAITEDLAEALWQRAARSYEAVSASQREQQAGVDPATRFLELLGAALTAGRAHVADRDGDAPKHPAAWGWQRAAYSGSFLSDWQCRGDRIGWLDGPNLYLDPDAAFAAAQRMARDSDDRVPVTLFTLIKRLRERGLLASTDTDTARKTSRIRRQLAGKQRNVLHLLAKDLSGSEADLSNKDEQDADQSTSVAAVISAGYVPNVGNVGSEDPAETAAKTSDNSTTALADFNAKPFLVKEPDKTDTCCITDLEVTDTNGSFVPRPLSDHRLREPTLADKSDVVTRHEEAA